MHADNYWIKVYGKIKAHNLSNGEFHNFSSVYVHPKFKTYQSFDDYDLAVLTINRPVELSQNVRPVCVPPISRKTSSLIYYQLLSIIIRAELWWQASDCRRLGNNKS